MYYAPRDVVDYVCPHCVALPKDTTCCVCQGTKWIDIYKVFSHGTHTWGYDRCICQACRVARGALRDIEQSQHHSSVKEREVHASNGREPIAKRRW